MSGFYSTIASLLPWLLVALTFVVTALGLRRIASPVFRGSRARSSAIAIAAVLGAAAAVVVELYYAGFSGMDTGPRPEYYVRAIPYAGIAGILVAAASIAGFAALTIGSPQRRWARLGSFIGPLVVIGLGFGLNEASVALNNLRFQAEMAEPTGGLAGVWLLDGCTCRFADHTPSRGGRDIPASVRRASMGPRQRADR